MIEKKIPYYPVLESELAKRGIKKKDVAKMLGIEDRTLSQKLTGKSDFKLPEAFAISKIIPNISTELLFSHSD